MRDLQYYLLVNIMFLRLANYSTKMMVFESMNVHELYYVGGVLFISGKGFVFHFHLDFCELLLLISISRSSKYY